MDCTDSMVTKLNNICLYFRIEQRGDADSGDADTLLKVPHIARSFLIRLL